MHPSTKLSLFMHEQDLLVINYTHERKIQRETVNDMKMIQFIVFCVDIPQITYMYQCMYVCILSAFLW